MPGRILNGSNISPALSDVVRTAPEVINLFGTLVPATNPVAKRVPILVVSGGGGAQRAKIRARSIFAG